MRSDSPDIELAIHVAGSVRDWPETRRVRRHTQRFEHTGDSLVKTRTLNASWSNTTFGRPQSSPGERIMQLVAKITF